MIFVLRISACRERCFQRLLIRNFTYHMAA